LSAFRNRSAKVGSGENAVVAIGQRLQGFPELSKGLHEQNSTNPFKNCNDLRSFCVFPVFRPFSTTQTRD
jgi:hypothetical protein